MLSWVFLMFGGLAFAVLRPSEIPDEQKIIVVTTPLTLGLLLGFLHGALHRDRYAGLIAAVICLAAGVCFLALLFS
ncbi:MAG: hypothetical protein AAGE65_14935 [Planctomycetota bacterium]